MELRDFEMVRARNLVMRVRTMNEDPERSKVAKSK